MGASLKPTNVVEVWGRFARIKNAFIEVCKVVRPICKGWPKKRLCCEWMEKTDEQLRVLKVFVKHIGIPLGFSV
ncbi:Hypothetical predicted protein [Olea europaea subsp. europaea]|uniref:Uncharacterized protein n=1 Tax=Olea europaea subsp. europaea TaxID=158383 RepID=A0A8S0SFI2_OLEEU|nr:Hypothetical predicted protein [Olea europaea subsp. europaea]